MVHLARVPGNRAFAPPPPRRRAARPTPRLAHGRGGADIPVCPNERDEQGRHDVCPDLSPQYVVAGVADVTSNFSKDGYLAGRPTGHRLYLRRRRVPGERFATAALAAARDDPVSLYRRLRRCNPAPFAGYFDAGEFQILSASPERFLQVLDGQVETRPIKGTRPRTGDPAADRAAEAELLASEKDRAENVMIVDLLRNDLTRVCRPESVRVGQLCGVEAYEHVLHLVSAVRGRLRDDRSPIDLVRAAFPGGSVTGRRRSGRWRSSPNWSRPPAAPIAARWATSASMAR